jgi:hypothetical protein
MPARGVARCAPSALYLATVIDIASRRVVGYALADSAAISA